MRLSICKTVAVTVALLVFMSGTPRRGLCAEPASIELWPEGVPGALATEVQEVVSTTPSGERHITSIHRPSITPYLPTADRAKGVAIVIAPGGGHSKLCVDHEGHNLARLLMDHGVAAFVLKYRLCREQGSKYTLEQHAVADMQRAIRVVRHRSREWGIDPDRVGALGFSAGGELAFLAAMDEGLPNPDSSDEIERISGRPNFQCLIYPGKSQRIQVSSSMPQAFIVCGYGDRKDISQGMAEVYLKFKEAGVPAELHIYSAAGHGFGVRESNKKAEGRWTSRLLEWLDDNVIVTAASK